MTNSKQTEALREAQASEAKEQPAPVAKPRKQEPVAWLDPWTRNNVTTDYDAYGKHGIPLYTSPPAQRKPLTLGQKQRLWSSVGDKPTLKDRVNAYGTAIEAAHGIKGDA